MFKIITRPQVSSTNSLAKKLAQKGKKNLVVAARCQTAGRGQRGQKWYSPAGGLYFSILVSPQATVLNLKELPCQVAQSLKKTIKKLFGFNAQIKRPNDLLMRHKKIAGILIESSVKSGQINYLIIGVGVNLTTDFSGTMLENTAAACNQFSSKKIKPGIFLKEFLKQFKKDFPLLAV